jgi:hypothetical protein
MITKEEFEYFKELWKKYNIKDDTNKLNVYTTLENINFWEDIKKKLESNDNNIRTSAEQIKRLQDWKQ